MKKQISIKNSNYPKCLEEIPTSKTKNWTNKKKKMPVPKMNKSPIINAKWINPSIFNKVTILANLIEGSMTSLQHPFISFYIFLNKKKFFTIYLFLGDKIWLIMK